MVLGSTAIAEPVARYGGLSVTEADLARLWEGQRFPAGALVSREGLALRVAFRGRAAGGPGPDFRDAVIAAGGEELQGDVELHVAASAFRQHGHHRDPAYDNVILHIVFWDDEQGETRLACGRSVPTVALAPWVARRERELRRWLAKPALWQEPCRTAPARLVPAAVAAVLEEAGDARFREKTAAFAAALAVEDEEEVLYRGLLEGLGYSRNRDPFRRLAEVLHWQALRRLLAAAQPDRRVVAAEAALLGAAGFLPADVSDEPYVAALQERWEVLGHETRDARHEARDRRHGTRDVRDGTPDNDSPTSHFPSLTTTLPWQLAGRPQNHPVRRLAGAARLLVNHVDEGLLSGLHAAVKAGPGGLAGILRVAGDGYWRDHYDLASGRVRVPGALIGPGRAAELAVNIVLPFVLAWAEMHGDIALADAATVAYRRHPAVPSYGQLRSLSAALGSRTAAGARRQQGMLHLFRRYCRRGGCAGGGGCPLS